MDPNGDVQKRPPALCPLEAEKHTCDRAFGKTNGPDDERLAKKTVIQRLLPRLGADVVTMPSYAMVTAD